MEFKKYFNKIKAIYFTERIWWYKLLKFSLNILKMALAKKNYNLNEGDIFIQVFTIT